MDGPPLRVDRADVRQTDDELTLTLGGGGVHIMVIRLRYDGWVDEIVNSAGSVAPGPGAWTLIGHDLCLELGPRTAQTLGFPRDCHLYLDVGDDVIEQVRATLVEILQCACFLIDTPEGRVSG